MILDLCDFLPFILFCLFVLFYYWHRVSSNELLSNIKVFLVLITCHITNVLITISIIGAIVIIVLTTITINIVGNITVTLIIVVVECGWIFVACSIFSVLISSWVIFFWRRINLDLQFKLWLILGWGWIFLKIFLYASHHISIFYSYYFLFRLVFDVELKW